MGGVWYVGGVWGRGGRCMGGVWGRGGMWEECGVEVVSGRSVG